MTNYNKVILAGNLTKDPELKYTPSNQPVVNFTIAINRNFVGTTGERKEEVSFIPIVVWGKQAETCNEYLKKGRGVLIEGRLKQRSWDTPDGQKRSAIDVVAERVLFLGSGGTKGTQETIPSEFSNEEHMGGSFNTMTKEDDEVPF